MSALYHLLKGVLAPSLRVICLLFPVFLSSSFTYASPKDDAQRSTHNPAFITSHLVKLGAASERLSSSVEQWSCVADDQSGLTWEKRDPTTALHGHDTYIWYQPEQADSGTPRAHPTLAWADSTCFGFNANDSSSFCNTSAYTDRVNQSNYCGYSDWRLPTADELLTLVDPLRKKRGVSPLIDTRFFPFHKPFLYWTNTVDENGTVSTIFSDDKVFANSERSDTIMLRLVRGNRYHFNQ